LNLSSVLLSFMRYPLRRCSLHQEAYIGTNSLSLSPLPLFSDG
jgi:hypothetical protein